MHRLISIISILLFATSLSAKDGIEWLATTYDFGTFREEAGIQTGYVRLVNHGPGETIINRVKSSCGCTVAEYTEDVIMPGDTAMVSFSYNPAGRPGRFSKSIKVYTGADNSLTTIIIRGLVIGRPESLKSQYPIEAGKLRLSSKELILGNVIKGNSRHEFIYGYNQSNDTLHLDWSNTHKSISMGTSKKIIEPGEIVTISIYYNSRDDDELGLREHKFDLITKDDKSSENCKITITANLKHDTSHLSKEDIANGSRIKLDSPTVDLGTIASNQKIKGKLVVSNEGKSTLNISRIYSLHKAFSIRKMPTKIKAGKSETIEFELDPSKINKGAFNIKAEIISNDPLRPTETIKIVGVKEESDKQ